jgi:hypothetical protein
LSFVPSPLLFPIWNADMMAGDEAALRRCPWGWQRKNKEAWIYNTMEPRGQLRMVYLHVLLKTLFLFVSFHM